MIADRIATEAEKARVSAAMKAWWWNRKLPAASDIAVGDAVALTGGTLRPMHVLAVKNGSAKCEWMHDGKRHTDWFCVAGLRIVTEAA